MRTSKEGIDTLNHMITGVGRRFLSHEESADSSSWELSDSSEVGYPMYTAAELATAKRAEKDAAWEGVGNYVDENMVIIRDYLNESSPILSPYDTHRDIMNHLMVDGDELSDAKEAMSKLQKIVEEHKKSKRKDDTWATKVNKSHLIKDAIDAIDVPKDAGLTPLNRDRFSRDDTKETPFDENKIAELTQSFAIQREKDAEEALKLKGELSVAQSAAAAASLDTAKATAAAQASAKEASAANETAAKQAREIERLREEMETMMKVLGERTMATIHEIEPSASDIVGKLDQKASVLSQRLKTDQDTVREKLLKRKPNATMPPKTGESHISASKFSSELTDLGSIKASKDLGPLTKTMGFSVR